MIPGRALHRLAAGICCAKTLERVVEPAIADLQKEYGASELHPIRNVYLLLRGYAAILKVIAICTATVSIESDDERRALVRTLAWSAGLIVAIFVLMVLPPLYRIDETLRGWYAATKYMPQAAPLAIPLGVVLGVAFGLSTRPRAESVKAVLFGALGASLLSFMILAWVMPAADGAFSDMRRRMARERGYQGTFVPPKAYNEMTLSELRSEAAKLAAEGEPLRARQFHFRFHFRVSLAVATFALVGLLLTFRVKRHAVRNLLAFALCFAYWLLMFAGELGSNRGYLTPPVGAWLPNLVFITSAIAIVFSRSSRLGVSDDVHP
jgi:hypothetical protein